MHAFPPVQIAGSKTEHHGLCRCDVGGDGNIIAVADPGDRKNVCLIGTVHDRVIEEYYEIQIIAFDHIDKLLFSANASGKKFVDLQVGCFFYVPAGHFGRVQFMPGQNILVGKAEIFNQALFTVVGDEADVHE